MIVLVLKSVLVLKGLKRGGKWYFLVWNRAGFFQTRFLIGWENNRDSDITMPLSPKTIGSAGYRDQWSKRFGRVLVNSRILRTGRHTPTKYFQEYLPGHRESRLNTASSKPNSKGFVPEFIASSIKRFNWNEHNYSHLSVHTSKRRALVKFSNCFGPMNAMLSSLTFWFFTC